MAIKRTVKKVLLLNPLTASTVIFYDAITGERTFEGSLGAAEQWLIDQGADVVESITQEVLEPLGGAIANSTLEVVRGLGGAIVDGLDSAYDAARDKLRGNEPDVIAGLVVASLSILTVVYLYHSAKTARDAF